MATPNVLDYTLGIVHVSGSVASPLGRKIVCPIHTASHPMSQLARNLNARRDFLGLTVPDVHKALENRGVEVAESTVYSWFNGSRGVRKMDHLKALCAVLQTDLNALGGDEIEVSEGPVPATIAREVSALDEASQQLVLALVRSLSKPRT